MRARTIVALAARSVAKQRQRAINRDPLPPDTPWWGVLLTRVATRLAWGIAVALSLGHC